MKALSTLKSAIDQTSLIAAVILISSISLVYPEIGLAESLQTSQGNQTALVFEIKDPKSTQENIQTTINQNSIAFQDVIQEDPLSKNLQAYLEQHGSPLKDYTAQLLTKENWKEVLSISFVESNFCVHQLYYNCSGIGGQKYFRHYTDFGGWIDDMSSLLASRYNGWSFDKMNGVYVQPRSNNWGNGSRKTFSDLTALEEQSHQQSIALANTSNNSVSVAATNVQLARFELK